MASLKYTKLERIWLKDHPELDERWLQDRIGEDPTLLGLGDLVLKDKERPSPGLGVSTCFSRTRRRTRDMRSRYNLARPTKHTSFARSSTGTSSGSVTHSTTTRR